jgi:hypothetical protein
MNRCTLCFFAAALSSIVWADADNDPIDVDRPSFTNTPVALAHGHVQLEMGTAWTASGGAWSWDAPEMFVRYGVHPGWEAQFGLPDWSRPNGSDGGLGDSSFGIEHQWTRKDAAIGLGTTVFVSAPTGATGFTSGAWDPGLELIASGNLNSRWNLGSMLMLDQVTQDGTKNQQADLSACFTYSVTDPLSAFFEFVGQSQSEGPQGLFFNTGLQFRTDLTHQWDVHASFRLDHNQPQTILGFGYAVRF